MWLLLSAVCAGNCLLRDEQLTEAISARKNLRGMGVIFIGKGCESSTVIELLQDKVYTGQDETGRSFHSRVNL